MGYNQIHETVVADIFETLRDGIKLVGDTVNPKTAKVRNARSIARATSGLTLAFPVICSNTLPLETATMIAKAIERKNVALLQMAFSAYNITSDSDAISHLSKFHQNLNLGKMDLDSFMDAMESLSESSNIYPNEIAAIKEDCKRNLNFILDDSINERSLLEYSEIHTMGRESIIYEAPRPKDLSGNPLSDDDMENMAYDNTGIGHSKEDIRWYYDQKNKEEKQKLDTIKVNNDARDKYRQASQNKNDQFTKQLLPSDVKKANE